MSGSACSPQCGWCGMCSAAYEDDRPTVTCIVCGRTFSVEEDEDRDYCSDLCAISAEADNQLDRVR